MTKKDILELKRRLKKNECTFTKMTGCYVDGEKNIVLTFSETFLNLEEEEFYKYLEIAKKTLSGTVGNNLLELNFPLEAEEPGGHQQFLMGLRESKLKNEELLETFYKQIIDTYDYAGNYLILLFHDAYDVMTKTSDNNKLDESEEVYEYILCSICPVTLSKPGLGYREDENRIGVRERDWVVGVPENGFVFPAFSDRSTDIHSVIYFTRNAKEPRPEFMEEGLGCPSKQTATEQKATFHSIIMSALPSEDDENNDIILEIQDSLNTLIEVQEAENPGYEEPMILTNDTIQEILNENDIPEEITCQIQETYQDVFGDEPPAVEHLLDSKALAAHAIRKKEKDLIQQVHNLQQQLEAVETIRQDSLHEQENQEEMDSYVSTGDGQAHSEEEDITQDNDFDVVLRVKPEKIPQITSQMINGRKCIVIPMDENEHANVNGDDTVF